MAVKAFRKKPVVIVAVQWNGTNVHEVYSFLHGAPTLDTAVAQDKWSDFESIHLGKDWHIKTLEDGPNGEAKHVASIGDWIIKGVQGEFYPCKPDIFDVTYDPEGDTPKNNKAVKTESSWQWWAGTDEEWCTVGPEDSREAIIQAATNDSLGENDDDNSWKLSFHIVEARQDPLRLADWIEADDLLDRAEDNVADSDRVTSEYDDGPYFECTSDQKRDLRERIERACDEWQAAHGLVFTCRTFSHTRNNEHVVVDLAIAALATTEGSDR